jgi:hypothetical protein
MTSWAVVCDVWYLEPQYLQPGETAIGFADRIGLSFHIQFCFSVMYFELYHKVISQNKKI